MGIDFNMLKITDFTDIMYNEIKSIYDSKGGKA
jgi:hypothetical protein